MLSVPAHHRVLLVEDESMVAMLLEDMLGDLGFEVVAAVASLDKAMAAIESTGFDVAILDVNLNGTDTYLAAEALKARSIPFVFATGYGNSGLKEEWNSVPLVEKPFQVEELERAIESALGGTGR